MEGKFEKILDECLERMLRGDSIEECLASYPEQARELEPLLRVALLTRRASSIEPRPEFKAAARYRLEGAFKAREERRRRRPFGLMGWRQAWVTMAATLLVLFVVGGGTVWASSGSLPGDPLYGVKLATEQVRSTFTFSQISKARLQVVLAENRVKEMAHLAEKDRLERMQELIPRLAAHLEKVERLAPASVPTPASIPAPAPTPASMAVVPEEEAKRVVESDEPGIALDQDQTELRALLEASAQRNLSVLEGVLEKAPEQAKPAIVRSLDRLKQHYEKTIKAFGGEGIKRGNPIDLPEPERRGR